MKKTKILLIVVALMLVVAICLTAAACGKKNNNNNDPVTPTPGPDNPTPGGNDTPTPGGNDTPTPGGTKLTDDDLATDKYAKLDADVQVIVNFASQYITNKAIDQLDNSENMEEAIAEELAGTNVREVKVSFVAGDGEVAAYYKLDFTFSTNDTYEYDGMGVLEAKTLVSGPTAGYKQSGEGVKFDTSFAEVYNAAIRTVNAAIDNGTLFANTYTDNGKDGIDAFSMSAHALFQFSYGDAPLTSYGLRVAGNIGRAAADTSLKIEVVDETNNNAVFGLYYIGKEAKLYLSLDFAWDEDVVDEDGNVVLDAKGDVKKEHKTYKHNIYIDQADINALVTHFIDAYLADADKREHNCKHETIVDDHCEGCGKYICQHVDIDPNVKNDKADCKCYKCGATMHLDDGKTLDKSGKPTDKADNNICDVCGKTIDILKNSNYGKFSKVLSDLGISAGSIISNMLDKLVSSTSTKLSNGGTRYQYSIDIEALLTEVEPLIKKLEGFDEITGEILPQFDITSFKGVGGTLLLSADLSKGKQPTLTGFQLAYNVAQKDFRWSKNDAEGTIYGPVNVAITADSVSIGEVQDVGTKANVEYTYFNPLNGEVTAEVTLTEKLGESVVSNVYELDAKAAFNPFVLGLAGIKETSSNVDGSAEIILTKKTDKTVYLHVWIHNLTVTKAEGKKDAWDCTVDVLFDGKYYTSKASESDFFKKLGKEFFIGQVFDNRNSVIATIRDYVEELIAQFKQDDPTQKDFEDYKQDVLTEVNKWAPGDGVGSTFMTAIKNKALNDIRAAAWDAATETESGAKAAYKKSCENVAKIYAEAKKEYKDQEKWENRTGVGAFDGFNIVKLLTNFGDVKEFVVAGKLNNKQFFDLKLGGQSISAEDFELDITNLTPSLWLDLDYNVYNKVMALLRVALPNLPTFDANAATVKVDMNYTQANHSKLVATIAYDKVTVEINASLVALFAADGKVDPNGKITCTVKVTYDKDVYNFDGTIKLNDWLEYVLVTDEEETAEAADQADGDIVAAPEVYKTVIKPNGSIVATLNTTIKGKQYNYEVALTLKGWDWDKKSGSATVTFKEGDDATKKDGKIVMQQFVEAVYTLGENNFDLTLSLASRNTTTNELNDAYHFDIKGSYNGDEDHPVVDLEIASVGEDNGFDLSLGAYYAGQNENGYMPLGIADPIVGVTVGLGYNGNKLTVAVDNLTIASWTKAVTITGFTTDNLVVAGDFDSNLYKAVTDILRPYMVGEIVE